MATRQGTIRGITNVSKAFMGVGTTSARDAREVWLLTVDFNDAYTGAADDANIAGVGAAIAATARDGRTRTLRAALPAFAGADANNQAVYGPTTVSSDALTGNLNVAAGTEITSTSGITKSVGILVAVD